MTINIVTFEGNLVETPKLDHTNHQSVPVADAVVLINRRVKAADGWVDADSTRRRVKAYRTLAEHFATLPKGAAVLIHGEVQTEAWIDGDTLQKRTADVVIIESVGLSLRFGPVAVGGLENLNQGVI